CFGSAYSRGRVRVSAAERTYPVRQQVDAETRRVQSPEASLARTAEPENRRTAEPQNHAAVESLSEPPQGSSEAELCAPQGSNRRQAGQTPPFHRGAGLCHGCDVCDHPGPVRVDPGKPGELQETSLSGRSC
ncbi:hypothetical protein AOLI_G00055650, partial [Acnodon oligacanthus]